MLGVPAVFVFAQILNEMIRPIRTRATRVRHSDAVDLLREMRAALFDSLIEETEGLELPGSVLRDGRVEPDP